MNESRKIIIRLGVIFVGLVFLIKLFSIQVLSDNYMQAAENNILQRIVEYPYRGLVYDRNGELLVINNPIYELMVVPMEVEVKDTALFCSLFDITKDEFVEKYKEARRYSVIKPSIFIKQISNTEFARIQDKLINFKGFYIYARSVRDYPYQTLANALGYVGEISKNQLDRDTTDYYRMGDYIGISGLESSYEKELRGTRGVKKRMVNVRGVEKGLYKDGRDDTLSVPGEDLVSTIDVEIQRYAEKLLAGKVGSLVAIEPETGEILSIVSSPSYEPGRLSGRVFSENFVELSQDTLVPLFNRPIMAMYPPGSMFKTLQSLIALQENVVKPDELIYSDGTLIGDLAPNGYYDIKDAITYSSNNYFFKLFRRIINQGDNPNPFLNARYGLEKWRDYVVKFGLGIRLGIDLPNPTSGYVPTLSYYDKIYGKNRWKFSNIYSLSIGQGETLVTPLQMANLAAILANKGYFYTPHIIKSIGKVGKPDPKYLIKNDVGIDTIHFQAVLAGMQEVVRSGSGRRAYMTNIIVCGKTSTVENPHGEDHSGFMGFAPKENAKIAVAVYVENAGQGGRAAASIASLIIEKYLTGEVKRKWLEDFALKGDFIY